MNINIEDDETAHLEAELVVEEGNRPVIYDDATGKPFLKGMTLVGNLSVGIGINLMVPFDADELQYLESHRIGKGRAMLLPYAWYNSQDEVRQVALGDLAYNIGIDGLLHWVHFLSYIAAKDYAAAANEIATNAVWISEVHVTRANRIKDMILTGTWPADVPV